MSLLDWRGYSIPALTLLVLIFMTGLVIILLKPVWSLKDQVPYNFETRFYHSCVNFHVSDKSEYSHLRLFNKYESFIIRYINEDRTKNIESETTGFQVASHPVMETEDNVWFTLKDTANNCWIACAYDEKGNPGLQKWLLHENPWNDKLKIDYSEFGDNIKVDYGVFKNLKCDFYIEDRGEITFIKISEELFNKMLTTPLEMIEKSDVFRNLAIELSDHTDYNFSNREMFQILTDKQRADWYKATVDNRRGRSFFSGIIRAYEDFEGSGKKDLLIEIAGNRFIPNYLYRYDPREHRVIWSKPSYASSDNLVIKDIDNDNIKEIMTGSYANGSGCGADWFDMETKATNFRSYLLVFDANGNVKTFNNKEAVLDNGGFTTYTKYHVTEDNKILTAPTYAHPSASKRHLLSVDFVNDRIDTLDITYNKAINFLETGDQIEFYHSNETHLYQTILDNKFNILSQDSLLADSNISFKKSNVLKLNQDRFMFCSPFTVIDNDLNVIYENDDQNIDKIILSEDEVFFTSIIHGTDEFKIYKLLITENNKINALYLIIWLFSMVTIIVYMITKYWFSLPQESVEGSYAVLYSFLGILYNWRIFGKTSVYTQPVIASFSKKHFFDTITDVCENYRQISARNLGVMNLRVYKLNIDNEMHIVQRIAHDIKNQLHLVNIKMQEEPFKPGEYPEKLVVAKNEISAALQEIFYKTSMLSNFSRINLMRQASCDLISIIDDLLIRYSAHPRLKDIHWDPKEKSINIIGDEVLLLTAILNIMENAIKYSPADTAIEVTVEPSDKKVMLKIKNQTMSADKTDKNGDQKNAFINFGSGIGLMITDKIVKSHDGSLNINIEDKTASVEIQLKRLGKT